MTEDTNESLSPNLIKEVRARIIADVLDNGIKSGAQLVLEGKSVFTSSDEEYNNSPGWVAVLPHVTMFNESLQEQVHKALYRGGFSVLPVITERHDEGLPHRYMRQSKYTDEDRALIQQRVNSSFLVVFTNIDKYPYLVPKVSVPCIDPADFLHIIFPQFIADEYLATHEIKIPHSVVGQIQRSIGSYNTDLFTVPDYENVVMQIAQKQDVGIGLSGIRLPVDAADLKLMQSSPDT